MTARRRPPGLWAWFAFGAALVAFLAVDLFLHRGERLRSRAAAITWSAVWVGVGLLFAIVVWAVLGVLSIGVILVCIGAAIWPSVRALRREARELRTHGAA